MEEREQGPQGVQGIQGVQGKSGTNERGPEGPVGPEGPGGSYEAIHRWRWRALTLWILLFSGLAYYGYTQLEDVDQKIQDERAFAQRDACRQTNTRNRNTVAILDKR